MTEIVQLEYSKSLHTYHQKILTSLPRNNRLQSISAANDSLLAVESLKHIMSGNNSNTKSKPMDEAAKERIMAAAAKNPESKTAQSGFDRIAQSAADKNIQAGVVSGPKDSQKEGSGSSSGSGSGSK